MDFKSPKAFFFSIMKINSPQQNKQITSFAKSSVKHCNVLRPCTSTRCSFYQPRTDRMEKLMSRTGMWEPQYSERTLKTVVKSTKAKRDLQHHPSYGLLICDLREAEKEAKMGFQS